jgi:hypothetical protein
MYQRSGDPNPRLIGEYVISKLIAIKGIIPLYYGRRNGGGRQGFNVTYEFADAVKSAFAMLFFRFLSMLKLQDSLDRGNQRKNAENILKVRIR